MRWLQKLWHAVSEPFRFLSPIRFVFVPLVLLAWGLISAAEGQDAVRAVIEMAPRCPDWSLVALFCAAVTATALQAWYWSRQMLRIDFPVTGTGHGDDGAGHATPARSRASSPPSIPTRRRTRSSSSPPKAAPETHCAVKPFVDRNVAHLRTIGRLVSGRELPRQLDSMQQEAMESEEAAEGDE